MYQTILARFNSISFTIIVSICALLPVFFLPSTISGLGAFKGILLYGGVLLAFSFWIIAQFIEGTLKIPKNWILAVIGGWILLSLASALMSAVPSVSLWGRGFAVDSFATTLILGLFAFLVASYAREQRKLIKLFLAAFAGSVVMLLLQIVLFSFNEMPLVATHLRHVALQGTLVGTWVDFAHFATFTFLLSLLMFEVLMPRGFFRFLSLAAMVLSVIALVFINFKAAWLIAIVVSLLVFVYKSSVERSLLRFFIRDDGREEVENTAAQQTRFPLMSFVALLVSLFFFLSSASVGAGLARVAGINFADIRPSLSSTMHVMRMSVVQDPVFGAGAGRYSDVWNLHHPTGVNQTAFWNTSFENGFSFLWTLITTNGILVTVAFVLILGLTIVHGFRLFTYQYPDRFSRFIAVTALIMSIAFAGLMILAAPGIVLISYGFMYIGLLIGVSTLVGKTRLIMLNYLKDPRLSFFAILLLVITAMIGFSSVYFAANRFAGIVSFNRVAAASDFSTAERRINRTLLHLETDTFWRTRSGLYGGQFGLEAAKQNPDTTALQTYFTNAEQSAQAAVVFDSTRAVNWLALSQVYRLIANQTNQEAYENAKAAADEALKRNPNNPAYVLNQAQVALSTRDFAAASSAIDAALALKPDYLDAFVLRAQIKASQGNSAAAREELAAYTKIAPFDVQGYVVLATAEAEAQNYQAALDALSKARQLAPGDPTIVLAYINTLISMGRRSDAITELERFGTMYPNVQGVQEQIRQLRNGASAAAPTVETEE